MIHQQKPIASTDSFSKGGLMTAFRGFSWRSFAVVVVVTHCLLLAGQTAPTVEPSASIVVSLSVDKDSAPVGQSPWAILTVENPTGNEISLPDYMYRIHVDGDKGEAPTTRVQRSLTGKLNQGEAPLRGGEFVIWTIPAKQSGVRKFQLAYLYDLSALGKYTVYAEVEDPSSQKWLRTNSVTFQIVASKQ